MTAWGLSIASFVLLAVIWKRNKPKLLWAVKPLLMLIGSSAFALTDWGRNTVAGSWMAGIFGWFGDWIGIGGAVVAGVVVTACAIIVVLDLFADRVANTPAMMSLFLLPLLCWIAAGPVATSGKQITANVVGVGVSSVGNLVGAGG